MKISSTVVTLFAGLILFSCKKNNDAPQNNDAPATPDPFQLPYNKVSIENNKAFLEAEGRDFIKKIESLPNVKAIDVLEVLGDLNAPDVNFEQRQIINIGRKSQKAGAILKVMTEINKPSSRKKGLSELYGIFTYNRTNGEWLKTASNDKLSFIFPSASNGSTNDANLTFTYKSSGVQLAPESDEDTYELPSEISGSLKVGSETVLSVLSAHTYYNDGLPKTTDTKIIVGDYSFSNIFKNENNIIEATMNISKGDSKLIEWALNSKNKSFDVKKLENADIDEVLGTANSTITLGNIKFVTWADIEQFAANRNEAYYPDYWEYFEDVEYNTPAFFQAQEQYYTAYTIADKLDRENEMEMYKNYSKAVVVNTKTNEIITSIDYILEESEYGTCYIYNENYETKCIEEYELTPILIFGDGSKVNFDVFGETGFENLKTDYEDFVDRF